MPAPPNSAAPEEFIREGARGHGDLDALRRKEAERALPVETSRGNPRVRQPEQRDVVEHIVAREAFGDSIEGARDQLEAVSCCGLRGRTCHSAGQHRPDRNADSGREASTTRRRDDGLTSALSPRAEHRSRKRALRLRNDSCCSIRTDGGTPMWIERGESAPEPETSAISRRDLVRRELTVVLSVALAGCRDSRANSRTGRGASQSSRSRQTDARQTEAGRSETRRAARSSRGSRASDDRTRRRAPESMWRRRSA